MAHEAETAEHEQREEGGLRLPASVVGTVDINRLSRELEAFEDYVRQTKARSAGQPLAPPRTSRMLDELAGLNRLNLLQDDARQQLTSFLQNLQDAPTIHISFSADPSAAFTQKIVGWLRDNIHPQLMVQVGLQPNIAAGCIVRTPNKVFDFSLRQNFTQKRQLLLEAIAEKGSVQ